jgi:hypothetical protein
MSSGVMSSSSLQCQRLTHTTTTYPTCPMTSLSLTPCSEQCAWLRAVQHEQASSQPHQLSRNACPGASHLCGSQHVSCHLGYQRRGPRPAWEQDDCCITMLRALLLASLPKHLPLYTGNLMILNIWIALHFSASQEHRNIILSSICSIC